MPARSLIIQTSFLGDTVLTTPLIARLAERTLVDIVVTPLSAPLLANNPAIRDVIVYDKRGADRGFGGIVRLAGRLRRNGYGAAYHAQGSVRSAALSLLARIEQRVGFVTSAGRRFYTTQVPYIENEHHAQRLLRLAGDGSSPATPQPRLFPGEPERVAVDALLREASWDGSERLIAVAPGSVWATKRWPFYAELAKQVAGRVVVIGSGADRELAAQVAGAAPSVIDATGKLSLLASAELIARSAVIVTNDSAPLHLASAMNTPTVAIFGPTVPEFGFGPLAARSVVLGHESLACRPCDRHGPQRCPLGHWRCMREITPRDVAMAVQELLAPSPPPTSQP